MHQNAQNAKQQAVNVIVHFIKECTHSIEIAQTKSTQQNAHEEKKHTSSARNSSTKLKNAKQAARY